MHSVTGPMFWILKEEVSNVGDDIQTGVDKPTLHHYHHQLI